MPRYQYALYNNQFPDAVQEKLDQLSGDGWHIHTASLNYSELYVLWEASEGASLEYRYAVYNNQYPAVVTEQMDKMSADGWHVHTALPAYTELYVLWERGGSALANRVASHLPQAQPAAQAVPRRAGGEKPQQGR